MVKIKSLFPRGRVKGFGPAVWIGGQLHIWDLQWGFGFLPRQRLPWLRWPELLLPRQPIYKSLIILAIALAVQSGGAYWTAVFVLL